MWRLATLLSAVALLFIVGPGCGGGNGGGTQNSAPIVSAGEDQTITLPASANLDGTVTDDGQPNPPGACTSQWALVSGPGQLDLADSTAVDTTANFSAVGTYVLRLTATDGSLQAADEVTITVEAASGANAAPTVAAGADQSAALAAAVQLDGTIADDGLPNPPGAWTCAWTQQSGPGTTTFADAAAVNTSATFSQTGTYVLRLTADDSEMTAHDETTVTVTEGDTNVAPQVNAGADQTITLPAMATLDGTVTDDGLPAPPGACTATWSVVSGPGTVDFGDANAVDTTATLSAVGTYVLRLTATDGALSNSDDVTITANASGDANVAPAVDAGEDQTITLPAGVTLNGTVTDDGLPNPPGAVTCTWSQFSGPADATFANASAVDTTATFPAAGTYVLRLTADDSVLWATDDVTITVAAAGTNAAPRANAGMDQTITLPAGATLDGTVTDDGLPNPPGACTTTWSQQSGPGTTAFADASAVDTTVTFSAAGAYVLRLTANDGALTGSDDVTITVNAGATNTGTVAFDASGYTGTGASATITVTDPDLAGQASVTVQVTSGTDPTGETITLTPGEGDGVFTGTVGFERPYSSTHQTPITAGNALVGVYAEGGTASETVTVTYNDAAAAGGTPGTATDTATYEEPSSTLTGIAQDGASAVAGAVIEINELGWQAASRPAPYAGHFSFYGVPSGTYTLVIAHDGHVIETRVGVVVP